VSWNNNVQKAFNKTNKIITQEQKSTVTYCDQAWKNFSMKNKYLHTKGERSLDLDFKVERQVKSINDMSEEQLLEKCIEFLREIGIKTRPGRIEGDSFLPGLSIENGCIIIDQASLKFPGDILHEAGHIAVVPASERDSLNAAIIESRENREAEEMMAIAWSYAACIYLDIDPYFVFHDNGYKGGGSNIADNFREKRYFGLPMLQWVGLATDEKNAVDMNVLPYPHMIRWLRD